MPSFIRQLVQAATESLDQAQHQYISYRQGQYPQQYQYQQRYPAYQQGPYQQPYPQQYYPQHPQQYPQYQQNPYQQHPYQQQPYPQQQYAQQQYPPQHPESPQHFQHPQSPVSPHPQHQQHFQAPVPPQSASPQQHAQARPPPTPQRPQAQSPPQQQNQQPRPPAPPVPPRQQAPPPRPPTPPPVSVEHDDDAPPPPYTEFDSNPVPQPEDVAPEAASHIPAPVPMSSGPTRRAAAAAAPQNLSSASSICAGYDKMTAEEYFVCAGIPTMDVCPACYRKFIVDTPFKSEFTLVHNRGATKDIMCVMPIKAVRHPWIEACDRASASTNPGDHELWFRHVATQIPGIMAECIATRKDIQTRLAALQAARAKNQFSQRAAQQQMRFGFGLSCANMIPGTYSINDPGRTVSAAGSNSLHAATLEAAEINVKALELDNIARDFAKFVGADENQKPTWE